MFRKTSPAGIAIITDSEGFRETAYQDPKKIWTIGWGHTSSAKPGMKITREQGILLLQKDLQVRENCVNNAVKVGLTQQQFDSLISLVYNIGCTAFKNSTLLQKLNARDYHGAYLEFPKWNKAGGKELGGLTTRRAKEQALWASGGNATQKNPIVPITGRTKTVVTNEGEVVQVQSGIPDNVIVYGAIAVGALGIGMLWRNFFQKMKAAIKAA